MNASDLNERVRRRKSKTEWIEILVVKPIMIPIFYAIWPVTVITKIMELIMEFFNQ